MSTQLTTRFSVATSVLILTAKAHYFSFSSLHSMKKLPCLSPFIAHADAADSSGHRYRWSAGVTSLGSDYRIYPNHVPLQLTVTLGGNVL